LNYLEQIKGFWIAQEVNQLGTSEIAMYFHMLEIWNKTAWAGTFYRNNYKVMADLSIRSPKTLQSIKDKLQQAGIIVYKQKNGDANCQYWMKDLGKIYRGNGRGLVEGLGKGSVQGSDVGLVGDNINETKPNKTKLSKSHSGDKPPAKKKSEREFWKRIVDVWDNFYQLKKNERYNYLKQDFASLEKIYDFLKKRSEERKWEWNEKNAVAGFEFFLEKAWNKDNWLKDNFSLPNLLSQFNLIVNGQQQGAGQNGKPATGAAVNTGSILAKIDSMPG